MKKFLILLLLPAVLYCNGKPRIQFEKTEHNFGRQEQNIEVKHVFAFKNAGDGTLVIDKISAG
ncbi:MAG: DUF1573 domain-containing protein [Spirochaetes bacterium]|nr:DUF1573 domain-containing protein [Spirochaetota bacterium]